MPIAACNQMVTRRYLFYDTKRKNVCMMKGSRSERCEQAAVDVQNLTVDKI